MPIGVTVKIALEAAGWVSVENIPDKAVDALEKASRTAIPLFSAVNEFYEAFHHTATDRWLMVTDGGESFTVNAPGILIASANPDRLDTNNSETKASTMVFTIGLDDKTVGNWLVWVGAQNNDPNRRPDVGFHYVS